MEHPERNAFRLAVMAEALARDIAGGTSFAAEIIFAGEEVSDLMLELRCGASTPPELKAQEVKALVDYLYFRKRKLPGVVTLQTALSPPYPKLFGPT